ncbi:Uncharacterized protein APZ42_015211 [Daphnia magna]|uniref:Uncharacterized protein n=1 Tax=Daphnia magna TaxID=35525 RepID=A0A162P9W7_9CRUS|nr:Uncharacterized protein APZ42_015211 [Daphnia magna]
MWVGETNPKLDDNQNNQVYRERNRDLTNKNFSFFFNAEPRTIKSYRFVVWF